MDWTQTLTIILSIVGINLVTFIYLMSRMDKQYGDLSNRIDKQYGDLTSRMDKHYGDLTSRMDIWSGRLVERIDSQFEELRKEIQKNREEILWIKFRIDPYENYKMYHEEEKSKEDKK